MPLLQIKPRAAGWARLVSEALAIQSLGASLLQHKRIGKEWKLNKCCCTSSFFFRLGFLLSTS